MALPNARMQSRIHFLHYDKNGCGRMWVDVDVELARNNACVVFEFKSMYHSVDIH